MESIVHFFEQCYRAQAHCTSQISTHVEWRYQGGNSQHVIIVFPIWRQSSKISLSHHKMGGIQIQYQNDLQLIQNSLKGCLLKKTLPTPQQRGFLGSQKSYIVFDHKFHFKALKDQRFMKPSRLSTVQTNTFLSFSTLTNIKSIEK